MALLNRFARLLRADVHAVLDRLEEPACLLQEALREMDEALARETREFAAAETQLRLLSGRRRDVLATLTRLTQELELVFSVSNEPLARALLRRRLEHERLAAQLDQRGAALDEELARRRARLDERRERLDTLRQKAALFEATDAGEEHYAVTSDASVTDADVELAWLRERQLRGAL